MRIVFMGTPEFAVPPLEHLVLNGHQVTAVYTQPDRAAGRGRALVSSPVKQAATALGLPVVQPVNFKKAETLKQLADFQPEVIVVAAYGLILPQAVLDIPKYKCVNIHPSLLPKFRGAAPVAAAILAGDEFAGISVMLMDAGMDTGPVLAQTQVVVSSQDTTGTLTDKLSLVAAHLLLETLPRWVAGELQPRPQEEAEASYTAPLTKSDGEINWHLPALEIWRRVRAFQPWPGCYTVWQGKQLKIIEAMPLPAEKNLQIGQVVTLSEAGALSTLRHSSGEASSGQAAFGVNTGDGILGVLKVQLEGKRAMPSAEFLRGQPRLVGVVLPSANAKL